MTQILLHAGRTVLFTSVIIGYIALVQALARRIFRVHEFRFEHRHNRAYWLRMSGLCLAVAIGMMASVSGIEQHTFAGDLYALLVDGLALTVFLVVALYVNDKLIVTDLDNSAAVADGNVAVGVTEFGSSVATGLIAYGCFSGEGGGTWLPIIVFFLVGQLTLIGFFRLFDWWHPVNFLWEIRAGNAAAGTVVAGILIALGLLIKTAIVGKFVSWNVSAEAYVKYTALGIMSLMLCQRIFEKLAARNRNSAVAHAEIVCGNMALAIGNAAGAIGIAAILSVLV